MKYLLTNLVAGLVGFGVGELCFRYRLPPRQAYPIIVAVGILCGAIAGMTDHLW